MSQIRVSILMTIYNAAPFLRESIDSLLAQDYQDWELIAVENGSTDQSAAILAQYKDPRIKVFSLQKNIGRTPALRYAFDQVQGEYTAVLDADDIAAPERLSVQVSFLDQHKEVVLVGSWALQIDEQSRVFDKWEPPAKAEDLYTCLAWINPFVHSSCMFRHAAAVSAGGYPQEYIYAQDFALILALAQKGKLGMIPEYLCRLRVFSRNMSNSFAHGKDVVREGLRLITYAGQHLTLDQKAMQMNRRSIAKYEIRSGIVELRSRAYGRGIRRIVVALLRNPDILWINGFVRSRFYAV